MHTYGRCKLMDFYQITKSKIGYLINKFYTNMSIYSTSEIKNLKLYSYYSVYKTIDTDKKIGNLYC